MIQRHFNNASEDVTTAGGVSRLPKYENEIYPGSMIAGGPITPPSIDLTTGRFTQGSFPAAKPSKRKRKPAKKSATQVPTPGGDHPVMDSEPRPLPEPIGITRSQFTAEAKPVVVKPSAVAGIAPEVALYAVGSTRSAAKPATTVKAVAAAPEPAEVPTTVPAPPADGDGYFNERRMVPGNTLAEAILRHAGIDPRTVPGAGLTVTEDEAWAEVDRRGIELTLPEPPPRRSTTCSSRKPSQWTRGTC